MNQLLNQSQAATVILGASPTQHRSSVASTQNSEPDDVQLPIDAIKVMYISGMLQNNGGGLRLVEELIDSILQSCYMFFKSCSTSFKSCHKPRFQLVVVLGLGSLPTPVRAVVVCESIPPRYVNPFASRATRVLLVSQGRR